MVKKDASNLSLKGKIFSSINGVSIGKARVLITGYNSIAVAVSDVDGNFDIYGLPSGKYDILIVAKDYNTYIQENIEVVVGIPTALTVPMSSSGIGGASSKEPSISFSLLDRITFVSEVYAQESCSTCVTCEGMVTDYKSYAAKHHDVYHSFGEALSGIPGTPYLTLGNSVEILGTPGIPGTPYLRKL
ncbi:MAG: carboxypeptidase regulatory-like domain-containing protein [Deltaproteobacteria bacterium]|nr:carboxypeptidase regulatory-like domain-containing protein [Deltaproteobacteria bacterium]